MAATITADEFFKAHPKPTVYFFQPETFAVLKDAKDLREWEAMMREKVGMSDLSFAATETCCESNGTNDCDTD